MISANPMSRLAALAALAAASGALRADEDHVAAAALRAAGLAKYWQLRLPLDPGQELADAYLVDDQIYACTQDGYAFAIHVDTGVLRWLRRVTDGGYRLRRPCHAGDRTIFVTPPEVVQFSRQFGEPLSRLELRSPAGSGPTADRQRYYFGSLNHRFYCFYLDDTFETWKATTGAPIASTPALFEGNLYVASGDGGVYSCVAFNKRARWLSPAGTTGPITADLVVDANGVYAASRDQSLYLFEPEFGRPRWRARLSGPLTEAPVVTQESAYQFCPDDGLVAITVSGFEYEKSLRWKLPRGRSTLTVFEKRVYVLSQDATILAVDDATGEVAHEIPAAGFALAMPSVERPVLLVAAADGRIFCAKPLNTPLVSLDEMRRALLPPGEPEEAATQPATRPAEAAAREDDALSGARGGPPIGGRSKVTREFGRGSGGSPATQPARP
jgi:outer membrane protein assembly factor BamB